MAELGKIQIGIRSKERSKRLSNGANSQYPIIWGMMLLMVALNLSEYRLCSLRGAARVSGLDASTDTVGPVSDGRTISSTDSSAAATASLAGLVESEPVLSGLDDEPLFDDSDRARKRFDFNCRGLAERRLVISATLLSINLILRYRASDPGPSVGFG